MTWERIDEYRAEARKRYGKLTPWRLGFITGELGDDAMACPYHHTAHSARLFEMGRAAGKEWIADKRAREAQDEARAVRQAHGEGGTG